MSKQRIGYIGVGLMGHGAAKNMLQQGHPLTIMGHRNRVPVDDLVALGAREAKTPADVARVSDVVFLCLPSTVEVEHAIYGEYGVLEGAAKGLIVVDSTTADPRSTQRIGADLAKKGIRMADAPLGRTPKEAEAGKLSTFVGGDPETVRELKPIIGCSSNVGGRFRFACAQRDQIVDRRTVMVAHRRQRIAFLQDVLRRAVSHEADADVTDPLLRHDSTSP